LWEKCKVNDFIPVDLAAAVAGVLKGVKSLEEAKKEDEELDSISIE
jgi:flagellar biosynthesis protein FlhB